MPARYIPDSVSFFNLSYFGNTHKPGILYVGLFYCLKKYLKINLERIRCAYTFVYMNEKRDQVIPVRVTKELKEALQEIAERRKHSVSLVIFSVLNSYAKKSSKK